VHQIFSVCRGPQGLATCKILGESDEGISRGRVGLKNLSPHISPVRGAGALIFLSSTGLCGTRVSAKYQPPKLNGGCRARVQTVSPFFRGRQRGKRSRGNYGLDQSDSCTKLSGSSPHLSCKGLFFFNFRLRPGNRPRKFI